MGDIFNQNSLTASIPKSFWPDSGETRNFILILFQLSPLAIWVIAGLSASSFPLPLILVLIYLLVLMWLMSQRKIRLDTWYAVCLQLPVIFIVMGFAMAPIFKYVDDTTFEFGIAFILVVMAIILPASALALVKNTPVLKETTRSSLRVAIGVYSVLLFLASLGWALFLTVVIPMLGTIH